MMRKSMFAALLVLIMLLCGCSDVSTAPTLNDESELVTETEATAEAESTKSIYSSESNAARSDTLKEKLAAIRADEQEQQRKELTKNEHRRRSGRTNRPNELGGL